MLVVKLMGVEHENVVFHIFPYTSDGKSSTSYFTKPAESITDWDLF